MYKRLSVPRESLVAKKALLAKYGKLLALELSNVDTNDLYALCFSRLLKENLYAELELIDGIQDKEFLYSCVNMTMIGTDQRDYLAPKRLHFFCNLC
ncbi:MAG: hypothetical protein ACLPX9_17465 [Rhodomicrobium sp.]